VADCPRPFVDFTSSSRLLSASGGLWELDELRLLAVAKLPDRDDGCLEAGEQAPRNSTEEGGRPVLKPVARAAHPKSRTQKQYCFSVRIALGVRISVLCAQRPNRTVCVSNTWAHSHEPHHELESLDRGFYARGAWPKPVASEHRGRNRVLLALHPRLHSCTYRPGRFSAREAQLPRPLHFCSSRQSRHDHRPGEEGVAAGLRLVFTRVHTRV